MAKCYWNDYEPYGLGGGSVVFTIHNLNYGQEAIREAMVACQKATTVSPTYALEISGEYAVQPGLGKMMGIRNGIDPEIWDPSDDEFLPVRYTSENCLEGKRACRDALRARMNLRGGNMPIIGIVTRLTQQKGVHLIKRAIYTALERGCQIVLLGSAFDPKMQEDFDRLANELGQNYWDMATLEFRYDEPLSHLIYAGADYLLVPSMFEPCGLSQLIAMRYGTIPIVRKTGGLHDTVFDFDADKRRAEAEMLECNGFSFDGTDDLAVDYGVHRAIDTFYNDEAWLRKMQARVMDQDWTWNKPALDYIELYRAAMKR